MSESERERVSQRERKRERERARERARERERERERETLIPGVPLNMYIYSLFVTVKHTLPHNKTNTCTSRREY